MEINISSHVLDLADHLIKHENLTKYEALTLALQVEKNEIIKRGLVVSSDDKTPSGLEAIVIAIRNS